MTTILAAAAVVLFAILIGIVVFFFFVYQREELENKKDEIKAQPGPYRPYTDVPSLHPVSCVSEKPFPDYTYTSKFQTEVSNRIQNRIDQKANEVVAFMNESFESVYEDIDTLNTRFDLLDTSFDNRDEEISKFEDRIEKLEKLVKHLYLERDEDMNEIENSVIDPYFKNKFENDKQLDTNEDNIE